MPGTLNDIEMEMQQLELLDLPLDKEEIMEMNSEELSELNKRLEELKET